jgi:hypothetical protein
MQRPRLTWSFFDSEFGGLAPFSLYSFGDAPG